MINTVNSNPSLIQKDLIGFKQSFNNIDLKLHPEKFYKTWVKCKNKFIQTLPFFLSNSEQERKYFSNMSIRILCSLPDTTLPELESIDAAEQALKNEEETDESFHSFAQNKLDLTHKRFLFTYDNNPDLRPFLVQHLLELEMIIRNLPTDPEKLKTTLLNVQENSLYLNIKLIKHEQTKQLTTLQGVSKLIQRCITNLGVSEDSMPREDQIQLNGRALINTYLEINKNLTLFISHLLDVQKPFSIIAPEPIASHFRDLVLNALPELIIKHFSFTCSFSERIELNNKKLIHIKCKEKNTKIKFTISIPRYLSNNKVVSARFSLYPTNPSKDLRLTAYSQSFNGHNYLNRELDIYKKLKTEHVPYILDLKPCHKKNSDLKGYKTPWAPLGDLYEFLKKNPQWPPNQRLQVARQITSSLLAVHKLEIAHLDLKPQNILLFSQDEARLIDFEHSLSFNFPKQITGGWGTRPYTSPEQFSSSWSPTSKMDIWSLGLVFLELFYGTPSNTFLIIYESFKDSWYRNTAYFSNILSSWQQAHSCIFSFLDQQHDSIAPLIQRMLAWSPYRRLEAIQVLNELNKNDNLAGFQEPVST